MNFPNDPNQKEIPDQAKNNPIYEQTRQDMPLWCCGRNCGRNSRIVVLVMTLIAMGCSIYGCLSPNYFSFVSLRNDTFFDEDKAQPEPFEYATEANVGLYRYEILDVYEYPWPPPNQRKQQRRLSDDLSQDDELRRLQDGDNATAAVGDGVNATVFDGNATALDGNATAAANATDPLLGANETVAPVDANATDTPLANATEAPGDGNGTVIPPVGPGSSTAEPGPTDPPTSSPTQTNPNDIVDATVDIGVVKSYPDGRDQFDGLFGNAQLGAMMAPIFAGIGTFFGLIELCCCTYKCSWLPTALFLYLAFMFQTFTLFLFLSEDFCKYAQDCALGFAGILSVVAVIFYMIAQSLICCTPRPPPCFNCIKKKPESKKKKKKKKKRDPNASDDLDDENDDPERDGLTRDYDPNNPEEFRDEDDDGYDDDNGYVDPYDVDPYDDETNGGNPSYMEPSVADDDTNMDTISDDDIYRDYDNDTYNQDADTYAQDTFGGDTNTNASYGDEETEYTEDDGETYGADSRYDESEYTTDDGDTYDNSRGGNSNPPRRSRDHSQAETSTNNTDGSGWSTGEDDTTQ